MQNIDIGDYKEIRISEVDRKEPIRVLHIIDGLGSGGAESVLMGLYRNIDKNKFQFDFLIRKNNCIYKEEIERLGGNVFVAPPFPKKWIKNYQFTKNFLNKREYQIIHIHGNALIYTYPLQIGRRLKIPCRIMHSHNIYTARKIYYPLHLLNKLRVNKYANIKLACSKEAGHWMFGNNRFTIVENGIIPEKFIFKKEVRTEYRKTLNVTDKFVIGNVARFLPSKNHVYLLKIFREILFEEESVLLLVGEGPEKENIEQLAEELGIREHIHFFGVRDDVNYLMQAMDAFVLPSHFEGLGIVLVEAQFAGLPCFASDIIPKESKISEQIEYISLGKNPKFWAKKIMESKKMKRSKIYLDKLDTAYDIKKSTKKLEEIYTKGVKRIKQ